MQIITNLSVDTIVFIINLIVFIIYLIVFIILYLMLAVRGPVSSLPISAAVSLAVVKHL